MTIVNHKYKFISIKTQKTAGTSMEISLSKFCDKSDIVSTIKPSDEKLRQALKYQGPTNYSFFSEKIPINFKALFILLKNLIKSIPFSKTIFNFKTPPVFLSFKLFKPVSKIDEHITLKDLRRHLPKKVFEDYYKFCIIRHPYDSMVSHYWWEVAKNDFERTKPFFEFVEKESFNHFRMTYDIVFISDKLLFNKCIRYENLEQDIREVSDRLNFPENLYDIFKSIKTKHLTRKDKSLNILDERSKKKIYEDWKFFFDIFDYKK